ncbi:DNA methyltransferase [Mesorhizobium sp.]|uniref:DNA methyltransferase n=1 Tax=Mesorhizobium sp. TaxID=1871066 RepID=UPI0025CF5184|nr:DNA methyltransferase [Mesorhizobium sp.]
MEPIGGLIKRRREAMGLSQQALADQIDVSKSYLSRIESGERSLTDDQAKLLGQMLGAPSELLLLESGRLPADVQGAIAADAAGVTTALRGRTEQSAVSYPTSPVRALSARSEVRIIDPDADVAIPARIEVSKASTTYRAHSYHTKVPPSAIKPFIEAFTERGDLVSDPFCGSGMTGVAALECERDALLSDLSPAAVHIARNYTAPCDPKAFRVAFERLKSAVEPTMRWLYNPVGIKEASVEYTVWSDVFACDACASEITYWDALHHGGGTELVCPTCTAVLNKANLKWVGERPVRTHVSEKGRRMTHHAPTAAEVALIDEVDQTAIPYWVPMTKFGSDREMWRSAHAAMGIADVAGFYTRRNLHALAALRHAIVGAAEGRVREALLFAFTACANRASKRYQWNAKRPTNVMTGTLYVSSLRYEWNVWSLFRRKAADVLRYFESRPATTCIAEVFQSSATDLGVIPDGAVDMVFMDPPFGSNIFYADSSLLWDAWLGAETDQAAEIVVNQRRARTAGGKDLDLYGDLMAQAFSEAARILRPGGRAVLAFSNTDDRVWTEVQDALSDAGLETHNVHVLDKGQPSIKGVKGQLGQERVTRLDLILTLAHRSRPRQERTKAPAAFIDASLKRALNESVTAPDHVYSAVLRDVLQSDFSTTDVTIASIERRRAALASNAVPAGALPDFVAGYLSSGTLPISTNPATPDTPPLARLVSGSRNTALYSAHSYHTKVPPEAIQPFIDHFTRPGDVVLDPFCGSGMTGVAAAMTGRRAILNDLSGAAVHLAWNHTHPCDPEALIHAFARLEARVGDNLSPLYATRDEAGRPALLRWTLWSTRHRCPRCRAEFMLWSTMDRKTGRMSRATACPTCGHEADRRRFEVVANSPAWVAFERKDGTRGERASDDQDVADAASLANIADEAPFPNVPLGPDREMYQRCALQLQGVRSVRDMYTDRNRVALARLWQGVLEEPDERLRRVMAFAFTNTAWHGTRMRRFNARGGHRPLTGTLYVPQLSAEANVLEVMRKKIRQLQAYYHALGPITHTPDILMASATDLSAVADGSIDYVFTDPPFGSNIFYADCNLIWESWLGRVTDPTQEAVVNRSLSAANGGKTLKDYSELMTSSMREIARVLKPGGWATVVFHNTDGEVWAALSAAAREAGFEFHEAASLDRKQQSHKGYKGREGLENVAHFDVVMNLRKVGAGAQAASTRLDLRTLVEDARAFPEVVARGVQGVHAEIMRRLVSEGRSDFPAFSDVRALMKTL